MKLTFSSVNSPKTVLITATDVPAIVIVILLFNSKPDSMSAIYNGERWIYASKLVDIFVWLCRNVG